MPSRARCDRIRATQARSSSSERALASEYMGWRWVTFSSRETGSAPPRRGGEGGAEGSGGGRSARGGPCGAEALGGRVGRDELGVVALDRAQLVEQGVVDVVADLRVVEDVVAVVVMGELPLELAGARGRRAAHSTSRAAGASRRARS